MPYCDSFRAMYPKQQHLKIYVQKAFTFEKMTQTLFLIPPLNTTKNSEHHHTINNKILKGGEKKDHFEKE